ncbi:MAG TPA: hypothetical protein VHD59_07500 [Pseudolabrys sp.]|nr:hypothetical protein [Pseudolabrys sp.]
MKQYKSLFDILYVYWKLYGGTAALVFSPYFHLSVLTALICYPLWWDNDKWASLALGSIPNLLGFSVGAFAIILSFGQVSLDLLKNQTEAKSRYLGVVVSFVHFIIVQSAALIVAMIGAAWGGKITGAIGSLLFAYAVILALAASMRLFRLARIYNQIKTDDAKPKGDNAAI